MKSKMISVSLIVLCIALAHRWFDQGQARQSLKAAKVLTPASSALQSPIPGEDPKGTTSKDKEREQSLRSAGLKEIPNAVSSEGDFQQLLENANLSTTLSIAKATQLLRNEDPARIAGYFSKALIDLGQKDNDQRERLVFIANELQSDQLLSFWQDIVARKPARFDDETKFLDYGEPTEELHSIQLELLDSIRNIGLIAARKGGAARFLADLILHPTSPLHDDFIRERAFISLKEADLPASIRVLKSLPQDDGLRARLISP